MSRSQRLWEVMDLGRGVLDVTELTLLIGGSLLIEVARHAPDLNSLLQLQVDATLHQLPAQLAKHQKYAVLADHLQGVLVHPGVEKVLDQVRYLATQVLNDVAQDEVWPVAGQLFSELLGRMDVMRVGFMTTSDGVADLIAAPLRIEAGMQVFDPAAHAGQLLVAVGRKLLSQGVDPGAVTLHGHESSMTAAALGQLNLLLNQLPQATLLARDSLRDETYPLSQYDVVVSLPPFGGDRGLDIERDPRFYRVRKGGRIKLETAYVQVGLAALKPGGQAAFLMPSSVLFGGYWGQMREVLSREGIVKAAVNLPSGLLSFAGVFTTLLVFDLPERGEAKSPTLRLVEVEVLGERSRSQRILKPESIDAVVKAIHGQEQEGIKVCDVTLEEQAEKDWVWLLSAYQQPDIQMESLGDTLKLLPAAIERAHHAEKQVETAMQNLQEVLVSARKAQ